MYNQSPTEKQISFADAIAKALNIDFPQSSLDYNKGSYRNFISTNVQAYYDLCNDDPGDDDFYWELSCFCPNQ